LETQVTFVLQVHGPVARNYLVLLRERLSIKQYLGWWREWE
jgi:hypothetical protein